MRSVLVVSMLTGGLVFFPLVGAEGQQPSPQASPVSLNRLPPDIDPTSLSRLSLKQPDARGVEAIRLHGSGVNVRWASPLGRAITELAILVTAREHDQPYEWSLHEMEAVAVGLPRSTIDVVRHRKSLYGLPEREAAIIALGRELYRTHSVSSATYARALRAFGAAHLVDLVDLMAAYTATGTRLTAFNQHMPPGWTQFLPLRFTLPDDIHPDSRSRLPLIRAKTVNPQTELYARQLAPEGTGPNHIARHAGGRASLEKSVGHRTMSLATLVTAREHHAASLWVDHERSARDAGLEPHVIDVVQRDAPVTELAERDAALILFGREIFRQHTVSATTYARALEAFGERDLVDLVDLMAQRASEAVLLAAFDQRLAPGAATPFPAH